MKSRRITAKGKPRAQTEGTCGQCGKELPHVVLPEPGYHDLPPEVKQERMDEVIYSFPEKPAPRPKPRMSPEVVRDLRSLGCAVPDYPKEGTPEWDDYVSTRKAAVAASLNSLPKVPNLRKGRGEKRTFDNRAAKGTAP